MDVVTFVCSLWPLFLFLIPVGLVGEIDNGGPLWLMVPALASILLGAYLAHKGGAMV